MAHPTLFSRLLTVCTFAAAGLAALAAPAAASVITNGILTPTITAGAPPDSPRARVDRNTPASLFSGVVSINIRFDGASYICSGTLVGKRTVISAGHCVDQDGQGTVVDINRPGNDVRVVFNSNGNVNALINAARVQIDPGYQGFGTCPPGVDSFCVNDDVAVITLAEDAPASARIYKVAVNPLESGTRIVMAGYGTSGDGVNGYYIDPSFTIKRRGENYVDLFDRDDEQGFTGQREVWYADFDGGGEDTFCDLLGPADRVCTPRLPNNREAGIGGGDSGGPSFIYLYGELMLAANNTFSGNFLGQVEGSFGTYFGGIILGSYTDFLLNAAGPDLALVPEPGGVALFGLGILLLLMTRKRWRH